jgi:hypothetical protein
MATVAETLRAPFVKTSEERRPLLLLIVVVLTMLFTWVGGVGKTLREAFSAPTLRTHGPFVWIAEWLPDMLWHVVVVLVAVALWNLRRWAVATFGLIAATKIILGLGVFSQRGMNIAEVSGWAWVVIALLNSGPVAVAAAYWRRFT